MYKWLCLTLVGSSLIAVGLISILIHHKIDVRRRSTGNGASEKQQRYMLLHATNSIDAGYLVLPGLHEGNVLVNRSMANMSILVVSITHSHAMLLSEHVNIEHVLLDDRVALHQVPSPYGAAYSRCTYQPDVPWNLDRIDQVQLPLDGYYNHLGSLPDGAGTTIYLLDTGVERDLYEFGERLRFPHTSATFCTGEEDSCTPEIDVHGHGTHMAGVMISKTFGVAKRASIISVKCIDDYGNGYWSDVVTALFWCVDDWLTRKDKAPSLVTISLGAPTITAINDILKMITSDKIGLPVIVSAGNSGDNACRYSPASASGTITVGSVDSEDHLSWFSNHGSCVDVLAPGQNVPSLALSGQTQPAVYSGTSVSAAHVSAAVARYMSAYPDDPSFHTPAACKRWLLEWASTALVPPGTTDALLNVNRHCGTLQFPLFGNFG